MADEHPFARFVRILARGPGRSRDLTREEAREAMSMIAQDQVLPEQVGAFLMLLRFKQETGEEMAGFVDALRAGSAIGPAGGSTGEASADLAAIDLDWPSYSSGKSRGLPWFLLSALLLAENGVRLFMHGYNSNPAHSSITTQAVVKHLGLPVCTSLGQAVEQLDRDNFAYAPLQTVSQTLQKLITLRPVLGLRSPANSLARMINPLRANAIMTGVFHPGYLQIHRDAAQRLDQQVLGVFKGGGGEAERNPGKSCLLHILQGGEMVEEVWPPTGNILPVSDRPTAPDLNDLTALWRGELSVEPGAAAIYADAEARVVGTAALALRLIGRASTPDAAQGLATRYWNNRDRSRFAA